MRCLNWSSCLKLSSPSTGFKLLVAGGDLNGTVEILDLERPNVTCKALNNLPMNLTAATGQLIQYDKPMICAGFGLNIAHYQHESTDCFLMRADHWEKVSPLSVYAQHASSAIFNFEGNEQIIIAGGFHADANEMSSNVSVFNGHEWIYNKLANLPHPVYKHCLLT